MLRVDVDALNENLRTNGALRLRHAMRPDEAFGVVVNFDGAIADMNAVRAAAWRALAAARGLPLPESRVRHPALHHTPPEVAAVRVLRWADSLKGGRELALEHAALAARALAEQAAPRAGVREWLAALGNFNVPTALVSTLDRETVRSALARMALHDHFSAMVRGASLGGAAGGGVVRGLGGGWRGGGLGRPGPGLAVAGPEPRVDAAAGASASKRRPRRQTPAVLSHPSPPPSNSPQQTPGPPPQTPLEPPPPPTPCKGNC